MDATTRKRDVDAAVQEVIDEVARRRSELTSGQLRTALATGLASIAVHLSDDDLDSWAKAISDGETIRAQTHYR